jgi:hypothetical protein
VGKGDRLVFPAASRPSIRRRISLFPNNLSITLDSWPPMVAGSLTGLGAFMFFTNMGLDV